MGGEGRGRERGRGLKCKRQIEMYLFYCYAIARPSGVLQGIKGIILKKELKKKSV